jgi:DNA-binding protein HU-beta
MNKVEFVNAVAEAAGLSKVDAARAVDAYAEVVKNALKTGDTVTLVGFGAFEVRERAARTGRNPRTGETLEIAASKTPSFKAGKALKDAVN